MTGKAKIKWVLALGLLVIVASWLCSPSKPTARQAAAAADTVQLLQTEGVIVETSGSTYYINSAKWYAFSAETQNMMGRAISADFQARHGGWVVKLVDAATKQRMGYADWSSKGFTEG